MRERPAVGVSGEAKNPNPVSGTGSSTLRGLFHPNASTVAHDCCGMVAGILNLDEILGEIQEQESRIKTGSREMRRSPRRCAAPAIVRISTAI
jgi:hypothetical protein